VKDNFTDTTRSSVASQECSSRYLPSMEVITPRLSSTPERRFALTSSDPKVMKSPNLASESSTKMLSRSKLVPLPRVGWKHRYLAFHKGEGSLRKCRFQKSRLHQTGTSVIDDATVKCSRCGGVATIHHHHGRGLEYFKMAVCEHCGFQWTLESANCAGRSYHRTYT
jgi:hypothetical protein